MVITSPSDPEDPPNKSVEGHVGFSILSERKKIVVFRMLVMGHFYILVSLGFIKEHFFHHSPSYFN